MHLDDWRRCGSAFVDNLYPKYITAPSYYENGLDVDIQPCGSSVSGSDPNPCLNRSLHRSSSTTSSGLPNFFPKHLSKQRIKAPRDLERVRIVKGRPNRVTTASIRLAVRVNTGNTSYIPKLRKLIHYGEPSNLLPSANKLNKHILPGCPNHAAKLHHPPLHRNPRPRHKTLHGLQPNPLHPPPHNRPPKTLLRLHNPPLDPNKHLRRSSSDPATKQKLVQAHRQRSRAHRGAPPRTAAIRAGD